MTKVATRERFTHDDDIFIGGRWQPGGGTHSIQVTNPATEQAFASVRSASAADVDAAVVAARAAFPSWATASVADRVGVIQRVLDEYTRRLPEFASRISREMGAPIGLASGAQVNSGVTHLGNAIKILEDFEFETDLGPTRLLREPIGVAGMITPWNWPLHQILSKVAPALAVGCTMVLKPSEVSPLNAILFAEVTEAAGVPDGVFNMVLGSGSDVGAAMAAHPDIDLISFTGSTRAGIQVARAAAESVKRVAQELGGKSPNILLDDVDLTESVTAAVKACYSNSGQSCNAPTRLLVPASMHDDVADIAGEVASGFVTGDPSRSDSDLGPVANARQFEHVQNLIGEGISSGARLVTGGLGRPRDLETGWYVRPTVFAGVSNESAIARREVFGPVLSIVPYRDEDEAVRLANDTEYGLAAYVSSADLGRAKAVGRRLRAGQVNINRGTHDGNVPFGGYKRSGNGRERGAVGMDDYLEYKALIGYSPERTGGRS
jgi:aldehyde dehydrogenase (NAD+)